MLFSAFLASVITFGAAVFLVKWSKTREDVLAAAAKGSLIVRDQEEKQQQQQKQPAGQEHSSHGGVVTVSRIPTT